MRRTGSSLLRSEPTGAFGINIEEWTIPVYEADETTPTYDVALHFLSDEEKQSWDTTRETFGHGPGFGHAVPIPANAIPDPEEDAHFAVVDWGRLQAWDMWAFRRRPDGRFESNTGTGRSRSTAWSWWTWRALPGARARPRHPQGRWPLAQEAVLVAAGVSLRRNRASVRPRRRFDRGNRTRLYFVAGAPATGAGRRVDCHRAIRHRPASFT